LSEIHSALKKKVKKKILKRKGGIMMSKKLLFGILAISIVVIAGWYLLSLRLKSLRLSIMKLKNQKPPFLLLPLFFILI